MIQVYNPPLQSGSETLAGLTDVSITSPANENVLFYNATAGKWENDFLNLADLGDVGLVSLAGGDTLAYNSSSGKWENIPFTLSELNDVGLGTLTDGDVLTWNSTAGAWQNKPSSGGTSYWGLNSTNDTYNTNSSGQALVNMSVSDNPNIPFQVRCGAYALGLSVRQHGSSAGHAFQMGVDEGSQQGFCQCFNGAGNPYEFWGIYFAGLDVSFRVGNYGANAESVRFTTDGAIQCVEISTPTTYPATGKAKLYFKSDDKLYRMDSSGNEVLIG